MHNPQEANSPTPESRLAKCLNYLLGDKVVTAMKGCADWLFCFEEVRHGKRLDNQGKELDNERRSIENESQYLKLSEEKIAAIERRIQSMRELIAKLTVSEDEKESLRIRCINPLVCAQADILLEIVARQKSLLQAPIVIYSRVGTAADAIQSIQALPPSNDGHMTRISSDGSGNNHNGEASQSFSESHPVAITSAAHAKGTAPPNAYPVGQGPASPGTN